MFTYLMEAIDHRSISSLIGVDGLFWRVTVPRRVWTRSLVANALHLCSLFVRLIRSRAVSATTHAHAIDTSMGTLLHVPSNATWPSATMIDLIHIRSKCCGESCASDAPRGPID